MDLSTIDGLSEEQTAKLSALFDNEVGGLKNKVDELLTEKKTATAGKTEAERLTEEARQANVKMAEEKLKLSGDMEGLKTHYETQLAESTALAESRAKQAQTSLDSMHKQTALSGVLANIHDDFKSIASDKLSNMLKIGYNDDGLVKTTFTDNGVTVADSVESFNSWAKEQNQFKGILKGVDSSGAGGHQTTGGVGEGNTVQSKLGQRLKAQGIT